VAQLVGTFLEVGPVRVTVTDVEVRDQVGVAAFADAVMVKMRVALETDLPGALTTLTWPG
jgi:hypothetical protein